MHNNRLRKQSRVTKRNHVTLYKMFTYTQKPRKETQNYISDELE